MNVSVNGTQTETVIRGTHHNGKREMLKQIQHVSIYQVSIPCKELRDLCNLHHTSYLNYSLMLRLLHDDVIKWKHFPRYWPFVWSPVNSTHKGQWRGALMFSLFSAWTNGWVNNRNTDDLRRYRTHYDGTVMSFQASISITVTHVNTHSRVPPAPPCVLIGYINSLSHIFCRVCAYNYVCSLHYLFMLYVRLCY